MKKFIELHRGSNGEPRLINLDQVTQVYSAETGSAVLILKHDPFPLVAVEDYKEVRLMIGAAQGGIPLEPSRQY